MPKNDDPDSTGGFSVWHKRLLVAGGIAGALSAVALGIKQWDDWHLPRPALVSECQAFDAAVRNEALAATAAVRTSQDEIAKKVIQLTQQSIQTQSQLLNDRLISLGTQIFQNDLAIQGYRDKGEEIPQFYIEQAISLEQQRKDVEGQIQMLLSQPVTQ